ncbi:hypothetical protein KJ853_03460 [Patescibacteria group bacterium]|nr:hypothetical protein [Patescibacteria group bacterium]
MVNQELIDFIKKSKETGQTDEQIKSTLLAKGWQEIDIDESFKSADATQNYSDILYSKTEDRESVASKSRNTSKKMLIIVVMVLVAGLGATAYFLIQSDKINFVPINKSEQIQTESAKLATIPDAKEKKFYPRAIQIQNEEPTLFQFDKEGKRVFWYAQDSSGKRLVIINNEKSKPYDEISRIIFSPDGQKFAYKAKLNGKEFIIVNGQEGKGYDSVGSPIFSPDSQKIAYRVSLDKKWRIVVNDKEGKPYDLIEEDSFIFSPDSQKIGYRAIQVGGGLKYFIVVNNQEGKLFDDVWGFIFSPDSKRFAYMANQNNKEFVITDGQESKAYDKLGNIVFSLDSQNFAYAAKQADKWSVIVNNREVKLYDTIGSLQFSPDSQKLAYVARQNEKEFLVINGEEHRSLIYKPYDYVYFSGFSPDSQKFAYSATRGGKMVAVVNDTEISKSYDYFMNNFKIYFSPDGKRFAFVARNGPELSAQYFAVIDSHEIGPYSNNFNFYGIMDAPPLFSPDSSRVVFRAQRQGKYFIVENEQEDKAYDYVYPPIFSKDGRNIAYMAKQGLKKTVVVNGVESKIYDDIDRNSLSFSEDGKKIMYGVEDGKEFWWIVEQVTESGTSAEVNQAQTPTDWQIYKNEKQMFNIQYPKDWQINEQFNRVEFRIFDKPNYYNFSILISDNPSKADSQAAAKAWLEEFKKTTPQFPISYSKEGEILVGNVKGYRYQGVNIGVVGEPSIDMVFISKPENNKIYQIQFPIDDPQPSLKIIDPKENYKKAYSMLNSLNFLTK